MIPPRENFQRGYYNTYYHSPLFVKCEVNVVVSVCWGSRLNHLLRFRDVTLLLNTALRLNN